MDIRFAFSEGYETVAKIIAVAQQKGGAGKTSLAIHLAVAWAQAGKRSALVDLDPQESLSDWFRLRASKDANGSLPLTHRRMESWELQVGVRKLAAEHDLVILDTPPHMDEEARFALRTSALVLVPLQPSPMDLWAGQGTIGLAAEESAEPVMVLNRIPPRGGGLTATAKEALKQLPARLAKSQIGNRVAFSSSLARGLGITEAEPKSRAAEEMRALATEVLALKVA